MAETLKGIEDDNNQLGTTVFLRSGPEETIATLAISKLGASKAVRDAIILALIDMGKEVRAQKSRAGQADLIHAKPPLSTGPTEERPEATDEASKLAKELGSSARLYMYDYKGNPGTTLVKPSTKESKADTEQIAA